jgi:hypothetical protein
MMPQTSRTCGLLLRKRGQKWYEHCKVGRTSTPTASIGIALARRGMPVPIATTAPTHAFAARPVGIAVVEVRLCAQRGSSCVKRGSSAGQAVLSGGQPGVKLC